MIDPVPVRLLIPNMVTALSVVLAVMALLQAVAGNFETAAWFVIWCVLLDRVDGVIARIMNATSKFGEQFDSLADMIAFGLVPAIVVYFLLTRDPRYMADYAEPLRHGFLLISVYTYVLAGALRLARFNITNQNLGSGWFRGLPTTIAGAVVMTLVLATWRNAWPPFVIEAMPAVLLACALLMISNLWLPKNLQWVPEGWLPPPRQLLIAIAPVIALVYALGAARQAPTLLLALAVGYAVVGFFLGSRFNPEVRQEGCLTDSFERKFDGTDGHA